MMFSWYARAAGRARRRGALAARTAPLRLDPSMADWAAFPVYPKVAGAPQTLPYRSLPAHAHSLLPIPISDSLLPPGITSPDHGGPRREPVRRSLELAAEACFARRAASCVLQL